MLVGQLRHRVANHVDPLLTKHRFISSLTLIDDFQPVILSGMIERDFGTPPPPPSQCTVEGDSIQPGKKLAVAAETCPV